MFDTVISEPDAIVNAFAVNFYSIFIISDSDPTVHCECFAAHAMTLSSFAYDNVILGLKLNNYITSK